MKTVLVGINSKYIHSCLAIWYLKANLINNLNVDDNTVIVTKEFTINDNKDNILSEIYKEKPDILAFSTYIWNIELVLLLADELKKILPFCTMILGGPEVSYDAKNVLEKNKSIDYVLCGEGEELLSSLYKCIINNTNEYTKFSGIAYRAGNTVVYNEGFNLVGNLDALNTPYSEDLIKSVANRIIYFESSRGCPFSCSYCISSTFQGVRFFSFDRVKQDLSEILKFSPRLIKFVDRTFNCNKQRAKDIIRFIIGLNTDTVFHFEAAADLFDAELLELLGQARPGSIQLEVGIQTTNKETLDEIIRITDLDRLKKNVLSILANKNIHVHLDLIAGLPFEDLEAFKKSFNEVYSMKPHQLQLGFLKLLKGSKIRKDADKHGIVFRSYAPYEILANNCITFDELLLLKDVEEVLERYYNSERFAESLSFIYDNLFSDAFELYYKLSVYCRKNGYLDRPISYRENILIIYRFFEDNIINIELKENFRQRMVLDFLSSDSSCAIPEYLKREGDMLHSNDIHLMLKDEEFIKHYLPKYYEDNMRVQAKNILKKVFFINLELNEGKELVMFDYTEKDSITEKYRKVFIK